MKKFLLFLGATLLFIGANAQVTDRALPEEWSKLVPGGRFLDRFEPMKGSLKGEHIWGCEGVQDRYVDNGIEDNIWSYWGGNIRLGDDGLYHMFVAAWLEASEKGHMEWPGSYIIHVVAEKPDGPFKPVQMVGRGHNPEFYRTADGTWVIYVIGGRYTSKSLYGPWTADKYTYDPRDRKIIEGLSNVTFADRQDGSRLAVCRGGGIWISRDGLDNLQQVSCERVYPAVEGAFEDPLVWRDNVQYHLIVNDWLGRIAWYLRSPDGFNWTVDPGEAYTPGIAVHGDGTQEDWFKYERIKVIQDEYGRAYQANFAVIDTLKHEDKMLDRHSSKNICIPLNKGVLMDIVSAGPITSKTKTIDLRVRAEQGFNPQKDIDFASLRFGSNELVNYGEGACVTSVRNDGAHVILTFDAKAAQIGPEEFAPKLLGKYADGHMLYGYTRVPGRDYTPAVLSTLKPVIENGEAVLKITNFGVSASTAASPVTLTQTIDGKVRTIAKGSAAPLAPYDSADLRLKLLRPVTPDLPLEVHLGSRTETF